MKKKMAMLLAFVMIVTSIEGSAFAVRGADFGSELVQITEEAEPQAGGEEISAEGFGSEEELKNEEEMASAENLGSEESVSDNVELNGETPLFSDEDEKNDTVMEEELEATGVIFDSENDTENIIADGETELFSDSGELKYENYLYTVWEDTAKITGYVGQEVSIEIPATINGYIVTEIGRSAFSGCEFEEVRLPESLVIIGDQAFDSSKLKEIIIPKNVKNMGISDYGGESSFAECKNLETVIFEEGMEKIPSFALCECKSVKNITIPESVREIAYAAFKNTGIETIKLPSLLVDIGQSSLSNCKSLKSIEIPSSVERIDRAAFAGCEFEEVRLPESLETIGTQAFDSSKLKEIIIPKNVTTMGDSYNGGKSSFAECKNLETVIFEEGMEKIPICALCECKSVKNITIPESVREIAYAAFKNTGIETIKLPPLLVDIGQSSLSNCKTLKSIEIPSSVERIDRAAFAGCEFEEVRLPESLETIGTQAFDSSKLKEIIIPKNVTTMGDSYNGGKSSFAECRNLETVIFEEGMEKIPICALCECKSVKNITIPESVREIAYAAFKNTGIETIKLPPLLVDIGQSSLSNCKTLKSIEIPSSVERIRSEAFLGCTKLNAVQIPRTVTYIGTSAFSNCPDLSIYGYSGSYAEIYANSNNIPFVVLDDEEIERGQGFDLTKDGHCIINDAPYFGYNSWKNWFGIFGYKIPLERYQEVYGDSYTKHIYEQNISTWKGNCFGMSATAALFYKKKLPVTDYVHNTGTLASGGYDNMISSNGRTYLKLNNDSELTKLIERYQIWLESNEYYQLCVKAIMNYGSGTDAERFSNVVNKIKNTKEPFLVLIKWGESKDSRAGHALVVDSSRTPQDLGDGWVRIYLYDPNNPYFGSFGDKKPFSNYTQAENRFLDVNISNGQWKMAAALNGNGESITSIGYDDSGNILRNSTVVFADVNDYPTNFNKKATFSPDKNKTNIAYASDNFEVYDKSNKLVYKMEDGKVSYCDDAIVKSFIDCGYIPGMDSGISNGKLMLPRGQYRVEVETGYISYMTDNDYAGIVTKDKAVVKNTDSTSLSVSSTSSNKVNIVIEDAQSDSYTSVETDIVADKNGCEVSLDDKKLNINTENQQQVDVSVIGNGKENEIEDVPIDSTTDIDLNEEHTEHTWDSGKITKKASCTEDGERIYTCTVCGKTNKTVIPATGHRLGAWRTTRAATALVTGIQERTCSVCGGAKQTRTIAKLKPTIKLSVPQSKTLPMTLKKSFTVKVSGLAKGDSVKSWSSSNKKIVTVTSKGKMSARKTGTVKITVTLRSGKTAWFKVKVQKSAVKTSKITGISKKVTLNKGKKYTLKPVLTPVTTLDKVKYSTSNKKVATVNSRGLIVAKGAGRATITVTAGRKKAKIVVTVPKVKTTKITGVKTSLTLKRGKSYRIRAKAYPKNSDEKITYSSSNKKIATVTSKGVIKAVKKGKVTITVKSGRKSVKVKLTVK